MTRPSHRFENIEQLLLVLLEKNDDAVFILDLPTEDAGAIALSYANPNVVSMFGYTQDQLSSSWDKQQAFPFLEKELLLDALQCQSKTGTVRQAYAMTFHHRDGAVISGELALVGVPDDSGTIRQWVGMCKSDPVQHDTEKELAKTTRLLTTIIDHIPTPLFIKKADDLSFVMFNKANEKITGLSNEDVVGKTDYDFFPSDQADFFTRIDREVLASGAIHDVEEEELSTPDMRKVLHTLKVSVPDDNGKPIFLLGISEDITARKEAEKILQNAYKDLEEQVAKRTEELTRLNQSLLQEIHDRKEVERSLETTEKYLYSIINRVPVIVFAISKEGVCTFSEGKGLESLGLSRGQMVGTNLLTYYQNDAEVASNLRRGLDGERFTSATFFQDVTLETTWVPNYTDGGDLDGCYGVSYDITQLKRSEEALLKYKDELELKVQERTSELMIANQQLKKLDRMRRSLVSTLTHDLRTPLIAQSRVLLMIQAEAAKVDNKNILMLMDGFLRNNQDLLNMINRMLETYELEDGRVQLTLEPVSLFQVAEGCVQELEPLATPKAILLANDISSDLPFIKADQLLIKRLFNNLIGNAINYIPVGSTIRLSAEVSGTAIEVSVWDNGQGIEPGVLPYLFTDHFARNVTKRKIGSGLGLYICRMIMTLHQGSIQVESSPEKGTRFYARFPYEMACGAKTKDYNTRVEQSGHSGDDAITCHLTNC